MENSERVIEGSSGLCCDEQWGGSLLNDFQEKASRFGMRSALYDFLHNWWWYSEEQLFWKQEMSVNGKWVNEERSTADKGMAANHQYTWPVLSLTTQLLRYSMVKFSVFHIRCVSWLSNKYRFFEWKISQSNYFCTNKLRWNGKVLRIIMFIRISLLWRITAIEVFVNWRGAGSN